MMKFAICFSVLLAGAIVCGAAQAEPVDPAGVSEAFSRAGQTYRAAQQDPSDHSLQDAFESYEHVCSIIKDETFEYADYYDFSRYNQAWIQFRRAEITLHPGRFADAGKLFFAVAGRRQDAVAAMALYMTGEAALREAVLEKYQALRDETYTPATAAWVDQKLQDAYDFFVDALAVDSISRHLEIAAEIRQHDALYEQALAAGAAGDLTGAKDKLDDFTYTAISPSSDGPWDGLIAYLETMRKFDVSLYDESAVDVPDLSSTDIFDGVFRHAVAGHVAGFRRLTDDDFRDVTEAMLDDAIRAYEDALADGEIEAGYWKAYLEFYRQTGDARASYAAFTRAAADTADPRMKKMAQDAEWKIILTDIDDEELTDEEITGIFGPASAENTKGREQAMAAAKFMYQNGMEADYRGQDTEFTIFCRKALQLLDYVSSQHDDADINHEAGFYRGFIHRLLAGKLRTEKYKGYFKAAEIFGDVGGKYSHEATYARARCLISGYEDNPAYIDSLNTALTLFTDLVKDHQSVRALYWWATFMPDPDPEAVAYAYRIVNEKTADRPEYALIHDDTEGHDEADEPDRHPFNGANIRMVVCPDTLIPGENVFYEKFISLESSLAIFLEESVEKIRRLVKPRRTLYPSSAPFDRSVLYSEAFYDLSADIPVELSPDTLWDLSVDVRSFRGCDTLPVVAATVAIPDLSDDHADKSLHNNGDGSYSKQGIYANHPLHVHITTDGYYHAVYPFPGQSEINIDTAVYLSRRVTFDPEAVTRFWSDQAVVRVRSDKDADLLFIDTGTESITPPDKLENEFNEKINLRDFAYDPVNFGFVIVDKSDANHIYTCDQSGDWEERTLHFGVADPDTLLEPEGIAVDADGNIYIADWGHHRIVIFDTSCSFIGQIGQFGRNTDPNSGQKARLVFPTRIAIEEDTESGCDPRREKHILVADRYGIHKFDPRGYYLDTPVSADSEDYGNGAFYDFKIDGYGEASTLSLIDRDEGTIYIYTANK